MKIELQVLDDDVDDGQLDEATAQLGGQLRELDVDSVGRPAAGPAPAGAKGLAEIAALVISVSNSKALSSVVGLVQSWLGAANRSRRVRLTIDGNELELDNASSAEQADLIRAWLAHHADG